MEDVLAVYTRPRDSDYPLVCLDETSKQLIAETRVPVPMKPGRVARIDYEYARNGTANLLMLFAPLEGWRHVEVTDRHTAVDYARVLKDLADRHFPHAKTIVLVQDNLNIHSKASLYEAFAAPEARRLVERFEWHLPAFTATREATECSVALRTQRIARLRPSQNANGHRVRDRRRDHAHSCAGRDTTLQ